MSDIVKGMAREAQCVLEGPSTTYDPARHEEAMRAALLWLADNVSDEMVDAYEQFFLSTATLYTRRQAIAAAIRAAAGDKENP